MTTPTTNIDISAFYKVRLTLVEKLTEEKQMLEMQLLENKIKLEGLGISTKRHSSHMTDQIFKDMLTKVMDNHVGYSSTYLIGKLGITYPIFKKFVKRNPKFIVFTGVNKGRLYYRYL
jgi:hypothetical protein